MMTLPKSHSTEQMKHNALKMPDVDFVNYWWAILRKQLLKKISEQEGRASSASAAVTQPVRTETVEQGDLDVTEDELRLIREMEEEEMRRDAVAKAAEEYETLRDSQDREDAALLEAVADQVEARKYRQWEDWELQQAADHGSRVPPGRHRLLLRGRVDQGVSQSMMWDLCPGQTLQIDVTFTPGTSSATMEQMVAGSPEGDAQASCDAGEGQGRVVETGEATTRRVPSPTEAVTEGPQGSGSGSGKRKWPGLNPEEVVVLEDSEL